LCRNLETPEVTQKHYAGGILFRTSHPIEANTPVELMMEIPDFITTSVAGPAICRGRVVRAGALPVLEDRWAFAATVLEFELARPFDPRRI